MKAKTQKKLLTGLLLILLAFGMAIAGCGDSGDPSNGNGNEGVPVVPETMSDKSALKYFQDEGVTVGINLGNYFDAVNNNNPASPFAQETAWGSPVVTQAYFTNLKALGFKIVRMPVSWVGHIGAAPNYTVDEAWLEKVAKAVNMAHNAGLKVFINMHHDGNHDTGGGWLYQLLDSAPTGNAAIYAKYEAAWKQIAEYFKNYGDYLMFQGFNELHTGDWGSGTNAQYQVINSLNQRFTNAVRGTGGNNAKRYLLYYGYNTHRTIATNPDFVLPTDSGNGTTRQIVGFHYYEPFPFSHDAYSETWDTPSFRTELETQFAAFKTKFIDNGIQVIIGENGPFKSKTNTATARENRLLFIDYMYGKARENGIVPHYWETPPASTTPTITDEWADAGLLNRTTGQPNSTESADVLARMVSAVTNATPPSGGTDGGGTGDTPTAPTNISGNLGNYAFGVTDTVPPGPNYQVAQWNLSSDNITKAQAAGTKLVLQLTNTPTADLVLVWQNPSTGPYWESANILDAGAPASASVNWNDGTKTLTITLNADTISDYAGSFMSQTSLNLLIGYWSDGSVNDLGITSANLE